MGRLLGVVAGCSLLASVWWGGVCGGGCRSGCVKVRRCATQGAACWVPYPGWLLCACAFLLWPVRWCVLGLPGLAGCLSVGPLSGLVVDSGDTRIGVGCGFRWGGGALGGVVACVLFLVRVNEVAHLGRKNLVSSSCGLGCCGWG